MGSFVLTDASIVVNSVNMSPFAKSATVSVEVDEQEDTAFGDSWRSRIGGLKEFSVDVEFNSDFAASAVDATLWPLIGTTTTVVLKATSDAVSSTNPSFTGTVLVTQYSPLDGQVGELATTSVSWPGASALVRATT